MAYMKQMVQRLATININVTLDTAVLVSSDDC